MPPFGTLTDIDVGGAPKWCPPNAIYIPASVLGEYTGTGWARLVEFTVSLRVMDESSPDTPAPPLPLEQIGSVAPEVLHEALPLGRWRRELLWRLDLPVRRAAIDDLSWLLDLPVWQGFGRHFAVSPSEVLAAPHRFARQHARTLAADLDYPIHLCPWRGRTVILDGFHRLLKAVLIGRDALPAMTLSAEDLDEISR